MKAPVELIMIDSLYQQSLLGSELNFERIVLLKTDSVFPGFNGKCLDK